MERVCAPRCGANRPRCVVGSSASRTQTCVMVVEDERMVQPSPWTTWLNDRLTQARIEYADRYRPPNPLNQPAVVNPNDVGR